MLAAVGLGGNTGGTLGAFARARDLLTKLLDGAAVSPLYRTAPQIDGGQDDFWNAVIAGYWSGSPEPLLERLLMIEAGEGRLRDPIRPKGPRILDLDLLIFGDAVRSSPRLSLPHPGLPERRFALEPLLSVVPDARDPRTGLPWAAILAGLAPQGVDLSARTW